MATGVKVALPGYNALTDTNPAHFSLFVDGSAEHILLKEQSRGTKTVSSSSESSQAHSLGYFPINMAHTLVSAGEYQLVYNAFGGAFNPFYTYVNTSNMYFGNQDASSRTFTYLIFHDQA